VCIYVQLRLPPSSLSPRHLRSYGGALHIRRMTLGRTLHRLRIERGWSQQTLAKRAQTSDATVCRLERGAQDPGLSLLRRLARALRLSLRDLVDPPPAPPPMPLQDARRRLAQPAP